MKKKAIHHSKQMSCAQQEAVTAGDLLCILAGPGCGKTFTVVARIFHLLETLHPWERIAVGTFTNQGATELRQRIEDAMPDQSHRVDVGTFHALAKLQLQKGAKRPATVTHALKRKIIECVCSAHDIEVGNTRLDDVIHEVDAALVRHPGGVKVPSTTYEVIAARYEEQLRRHNNRDMADDIRAAVHGMSHGTVAPLGVRHLLIDEFQDSDALQLDWVHLHVKGKVLVTVCGDDDQSIYKFRRALGYAAVLAFLEQTNAPTVVLNASYRCGSEIVRHANQLIAHNDPNRVPKKLVSAADYAGTVTIHAFMSERREAEYIVERVSAPGEELGKWAVLGRNRKNLDLIAEALKDAGIPHEIIGETSFWDLEPMAAFLEALAFVAGVEESGLALLLYHAKVSREHVNELLESLAASKDPLAVAFRGFESFECSRDTQALWILQEVLATCMAAFAEGDIETVMNELFDYFEVWSPRFVTPKQREAAISSICGHCDDKPLAEVVRRLRRKAKPGDDPRPRASVVRLSTLHSAKGLEWDNVFLVRSEEGVMPASRSDACDERNLFYVGMTRARHQLIITFTVCKKRKVSRFAVEAGLFDEEEKSAA